MGVTRVGAWDEATITSCNDFKDSEPVVTTPPGPPPCATDDILIKLAMEGGNVNCCACWTDKEMGDDCAGGSLLTGGGGCFMERFSSAVVCG